ncbi:uncharacterized protein [Dysidea avara]|uniref:uncharacterized protein n=1 Tax=Dysidea avara TaxID=196820 RepID=UPI00331EA41E
MKILTQLWLLLAFLVGVSIQQCTIEEFQMIAINMINSSKATNVSRTIRITNTYYNCLSLFDTGDHYSSMSVSIIYIRSDDLNNIHEVRYNLQCNNSVWEIVGNQSTVLRNNNTRYCEDCTDQTVNEYHCTVGDARHYYIAFFSNNVPMSHRGQPSIVLMTSEIHPVYYIVEAPGVDYYASNFVTNNTEVILNLTNNNLITSSHDQDKGIHLMINSDRVTVIGQNLRHHSDETFLCLPITSLCVDEYVYYGISVPRGNDTFSSNQNSSILVVGTEDNTLMKLTVTQPVTISVSNCTDDLTTGIQYSYVINRLQTVLIGSVDDLTGTKIVTDKPASVISGHQCAVVPGNVVGCDYIIEQVPPTTLWGRVYYTAPLATRRSYTIKVLAAYNSTVVDIYCNNTRECHNISEGESVNITLSLQEHCVINSSKEVLVVQFSHGWKDDNTDQYGDPMMTLVPATNQYSNKFQFSTLQDQSEDYTHYINIIVLAQYYQPDMIYLISGGLNRSLDTHQWAPFMVNNVTEAYSVQVNISKGVGEVVHSNTTALMSTVVYGFGNRIAYGHPGGNDITVVFAG